MEKTKRLLFLFLCPCGCGKIFTARSQYRKGVSGLTYIKYAPGHHPGSKEHQTGNKPAWNKGLTKKEHPSISKMGFQPGHDSYNDWSNVNKRLREDSVLRKRWIESKKKQVPWNKGIGRDGYPNGIKSGPNHGNWCGNVRGPHDLARMKRLKVNVLKRDNYTCQECGDRNYKGRGKRCSLEVHHIISVAEDLSLAFDPNNLTTLCHRCHIKTDNYGTKVVNKIRKQGGN